MGSCDISLRETRGRCAKEDIIDRLWQEERFHDCRVSGLLEHRTGADTNSVRSVRRASGMEECGNTLGVQAPNEPLELSIIDHSMV